jgi:hypothetical protein
VLADIRLHLHHASNTRECARLLMHEQATEQVLGYLDRGPQVERTRQSKELMIGQLPSWRPRDTVGQRQSTLSG